MPVHAEHRRLAPDAEIAQLQAAVQPGLAIVRLATLVLKSARWSTGLGLLAAAAAWQFLPQLGFVPIAHYLGTVGAMLIGACLGGPLDVIWKRFR